MGTEEANRKDRLAELNKLPGIKLPNYFYRNTGNLSFEDMSEQAGFTKPTYSNGMAYTDLDNDGDLDLVVNNIDDPAGVYQNTGPETNKGHFIKFGFSGEPPNRNGIGAQVEIRYSGLRQKQYHTPYRGYLSSVEEGLHFGLGNYTTLDTVIVDWPDGKSQLLRNVSADRQITLSYSEAREKENIPDIPPRHSFHRLDSTGLDFEHREDEFVDFKIQPLLPHMHSRNGPGIAVGDINGDGLEDCHVGGAAGQPASLMVQQPDGSFLQSPFPDQEYEDMGSLFFDADRDGDLDLYVVSGGGSFPAGDSRYQDRLYINDGQGNFSRGDLPGWVSSGSVVTGADYNKDGKLDLFVGGRIRPGEYPLPPKSALLTNKSKPGQPLFELDSSQPDITQLGMVTAAVWTDFNNDTWPDLIIAGEFMPVRVFQNNEGTLKEITSGAGLDHSHGWWNSITPGDFDEDGDMDYILGNLGLNSRFRASEKEPLCIYAKDFDKNGMIDPVMCHYIDGKNYVAHSRNDLIEQINAMRGRFRTYTDYAEATFEESFLKEELKDAYVVKSETFANSVLENLGDGKFELTPLPTMAQIAPMYGMLTGHFNEDHHLDLLAVGNFFSGEVFSGQYDASIGWFLAGDGRGGFTPVNSRESGFLVEGDGKSLVRIWSGNQQLFLAGINNGPLSVQAYHKPGATRYYPKPNEVGGIITYSDGSVQKFEFNRGLGYLSQPSLSLELPEDAISVRIADDRGGYSEILATP
jgi:hypothetical protein